MSKDEKIVHVFLNLSSPKVKVGTLVQKNEKIFFEYDNKFLKSTLEISKSLLLRYHLKREFLNALKVLFGVFLMIQFLVAWNNYS
jgi:hypothetical protein